MQRAVGKEPKLSHMLYEQGFRCVFNTREHVGSPTRQKELVTIGKPYRTNHDRFLIVIYDEMGHPWLAALTEARLIYAKTIALQYSLVEGGYIPHAYDQGAILRPVLVSSTR